MPLMRCTEAAFFDVIKKSMKKVFDKLNICRYKKLETEDCDDEIYLQRNLSLVSSDMIGLTRRASMIDQD